jgi:hypothetical protein
MRRIIFGLVVLATLGAQSLAAAELRFSIGVRKTNPAGPIGANGGTSGDIDWVGRPDDGITDTDVNLVQADSAWHLVTFDLNAGPFNGFTGTGVVTSTTGFGTLEHLRIANTADGVTHYKVYIDDVTNTVNGVPTLLTNFDSATLGSEVLFQDPGFSGSTAAKLTATPNINAVTSDQSFSGPNSYLLDFNFVSDAPAGVGTAGNWARVTTNSALVLPNATIGVPGGPTNTSTLSMRIRIEVDAVPEPASLVFSVMAGLVLAGMRRR